MHAQGERGRTMVVFRDVHIVRLVPITHQQVNRPVRLVAVVIFVPVVRIGRHVLQPSNLVRQLQIRS